MKNIILVFTCLLSLNIWSQSQMPNLRLKNLENDYKNVYSDYIEEDKIYVFSFWATWCAPCLSELENIYENLDEWQKEANFEIIAVSVDDARTVKRVKPLINGKDWDYEVLLDTNQQLKRTLQISNVPHVIIVKNQKVEYVHNGYVEGAEKELFEEIKSL